LYALLAAFGIAYVALFVPVTALKWRHRRDDDWPHGLYRFPGAGEPGPGGRDEAGS